MRILVSSLFVSLHRSQMKSPAKRAISGAVCFASRDSVITSLPGRIISLSLRSKPNFSTQSLAGERLNYVGLNVRHRAHAYSGSAKRCGTCSQKAPCTSGRYKYLAIHIHESARQRAPELANTPEFAQAQRQRKKVEALFAELKNQIGLRRLRLRRMKFVREQFFLAAAAQNIKRLVRFLSQPTAPVLPATA